MKRCMFALTVLLLCVALAPAAPASSTTAPRHSWPQWRGPDHNGISKETNWDPAALSRGPKLAWKAQIGKGFGSIAIAGGRIYCRSNDQGLLVCVDVSK